MKGVLRILLLLCSLSMALSSHAQEAVNTKKADIIFVVDNSGSMSAIQDKIIKSSAQFLNTLNSRAKLDWKIGVISTDQSDVPYLGFASEFSSASIGPNIDVANQVFGQAIRDLGVNGDYQELSFYNLERALKEFPQFHRPDADLAVIFVTDENEQSVEVQGSSYNWQRFVYRLMQDYVGLSNHTRFYGVFDLKELDGCRGANTYLPYPETAFKSLIEFSKGFAVSACNDDTADGINSIAYDIIKMAIFE